MTRRQGGNTKEFSNLFLSPAQSANSTQSPACASAHKVYSTFWTLWPSKSFSASSGIDYAPLQSERDIQNRPSLPVLRFPAVEFQPDRNQERGVSPRLPRHVPIVIPDFAQPYATRRQRDSGGQSPHRSLNLEISPYLRHKTRTLSSTHAIATSAKSISSKDRAKEKSVVSSEAFVSIAMSGSQVSLTASESGADHGDGSAPTTTNNARQESVNQNSAGVTSPTAQSGSGGANLSGLVCNVHRTTGQEPHALVGATTTILGDKLYVFGGRIHSRSRPALTSDLYELDLIRRHWSKVEATGDIPPPRYFHSACALGDTKLVCYGGMSPAPAMRNSGSNQSQQQQVEPQPEVVVMSDIHIFDVTTRSWILVQPSGAGQGEPQGRYAHCASILPSSAVFASPTAAHSAIHHNQPSSDPHSGTLGVQLDGSGGAEMIVIGGQDSENNYIEQISIFNLRSLKWTSVVQYDRKCGAYKSMTAPLTGLNTDAIGQGLPLGENAASSTGTSTLIYSNYNFLDVKLELQVRYPDGTLIEKTMNSAESPPGLRFPNGGIIHNHFVVSGTYLTSSKHEYSIWALDLRTLQWHQIDTAGSVFGSGSWNRGILWTRRSTFVILGHRKRNLIEDYNHRRINFTHVCMVELEAYGLYDNPRQSTPSSSYISVSAPAVPQSQQPNLSTLTAGGRLLSSVAEQLGQSALALSEVSDMELVAVGGERIACNSSILARRWGPFFIHMLAESSTAAETKTLSDTTTLRGDKQSIHSRNSALTITPLAINGNLPQFPEPGSDVASKRSMSHSTTSGRTLVELPNNTVTPASLRPRSLYLPHTEPTIRLLLHFLYTSSLPPLSSPMCSPHTLCSLLQMARPCQIDGLLEATVQRLHEVLDGRNAAAVFNAAAMAAGGGRATGSLQAGTLVELERQETASLSARPGSSFNKSLPMRLRGHQKTGSTDSTSTTASVSTGTGVSQTDTEASNHDADVRNRDSRREVWEGELSSVIGLQKRGLRGLMEGRKLRERANTGGAENT